MEALKKQIEQMKMGEIRELMKFCNDVLKEKSKARDKHLLKSCTDIWHRYYNVKKGIDYQYDGSDINALKMIIKKCRGALQDDETTDDAVEAFFITFLKHINDEWILNHLSIKLINSKFNSLLAQASKKIKESEQTKKHFERYD